MAARRDPAAVVVDFFTTAPLEAAQTVLAIVKGIVAKRAPKTRTRAQRTTSTEAAAPESK